MATVFNNIVLYFLLFINAYLLLNALYLFFFALASKLKYTPKKRSSSINNKRFVIVVPAYKNDAVIIESLKFNFRQYYPKDCYEIIVAGDKLEPETIEELRKINPMPNNILDLQLESSSKVKSLRHTYDIIKNGNFDYLIMLDIDNLMEPNYLSKLNNFIQDKHIAIQTHRVAKNLDTPYSILDAISEEVNNNVFRKGHRNMGLSAALIGSGVIFKVDYYLENLMKWKAVGGFDKELEIELAQNNIRVYYADDILVYDEKTRYLDELKVQRTRWLSAQFFYLRTNIFKSLSILLRNGNFNYIDKILQYALLPRILMSGILFMFFVFHLCFFPQFIGIATLNILLNIATLALTIPKKFINKKIANAVLYLPITFFTLFFNLRKLKGANRRFIITPHHTTKGPR
ncbi:MAG: glycosyltransferase [Bacteroidetes bacterium]|nr:glycosyltransferase [Bacteroidota bacterium]